MNNLQEGLYAQAGVLASRKNSFIRDYKRLSNPIKPFDRLTEAEIFYWTALYFNVGEPRGKDLLQQFRGEAQKGRQLDSSYSYDALSNAAIRVMIMEILRESGIFDENCEKYLITVN